MVNPNRFYTYAYLREDRTPYYIGKGQRGRAYQGKGKPCRVPKDKTRIIFLKQNLTEEEAFRHEIYMIAVFGRKDLGTGILRNKTDGGEGCSGFIVREESKRKQSQKMKGKYVGKKWWNDNCGNNKFSIEYPGEGWVLGQSEETKRKRSETSKGESRFKYGRKGEDNPCYGKKWWNDGCGNSKRAVECPGEGWVLGRNKEVHIKINEKMKNKKWWNDGCGNNKRSLGCPGEGWVLGLDNKKSKELGLGIHSLTTEQLSETGKKVASQKWECLETGFITNAGNLTKYQKKRDIDTSKRVKIS